MIAVRFVERLDEVCDWRAEQLLRYLYFLLKRWLHAPRAFQATTSHGELLLHGYGLLIGDPPAWPPPPLSGRD
jgi:hypothetical protein